MKTLSSAMIDVLGAEASRLCFCWKVTRRDMLVQGFTDHSHDLIFDDVVYLASDGIETTTISQSLGLSVDNLNLNGAISSTSLNETDLEDGLYDDAEVVLLLVDWSNVSTRMVVARGSVGEVKRYETAFSTEFRSMAHRLNQKSGRTYQRYCDANLGDSRCGKNLASSTFTLAVGTVTTADERLLSVSGAEAYTDGWFDRGLLTVLTGSAAGLIIEVKEHARVGIELWTTPSSQIMAGDTVRIVAGCDKSYSTCKSKFSNGTNFRGSPYIPGNDILTWVASAGKEVYDGGSLFK